MTLKRFDAVIWRHNFDFQKDPHEYFYQTLLLNYPWRDESQLFPNDFEKYQELYRREEQHIQTVKCTLFPHLLKVESGKTMVGASKENSRISTKTVPEGEQANE